MSDKRQAADPASKESLRTETMILTRSEWMAIATLRTVSRLAVDKGIVALPTRVLAAVDTVQLALDRTRKEVNGQ